MTTLAELEEEARRRVLAVSDDTSARLALREAWYERYGAGTPLEPLGFGRSEIDFMKWEIERGVLNALGSAQPGSDWWRAVNSTILYHAELAGLVVENQLTHELVAEETRAWIDYIQKPDSQGWYKAHNSSIVRGYLAHVPMAKLENENEQYFMNEVLYRLLYAEALVIGVAMGELGEWASDPRLPAVDILCHIPEMYPRHYQLTPADVINIHHLSDTVGDDLAKVLDELLILPHIEKLYHLVAGILEQPELEKAIRDGQPVYPDLGPVRTALRARKPKQKIAILGSGCSALATAWELTNHDGWRDRYDITIYTLGWRVGGKTATGRGPFARIEEHGIHILQGWYDETFRILESVYAERAEKRLDPRSPFQTWQDGFERNDSTLITEYIEGRGWVNWPLILPPNEYVPGQGGPLPTWAVIKKLVGLAFEMLLGSPYQSGINPISKWILDHFFPKDGEDHALRALSSALDSFEMPLSENEMATIGKVVDVLRRGVTHLESGVSELNADHDKLRRILLLVELLCVNLAGIVADVWDPETRSFEWTKIDHLDYREWIRGHGASPRVADSAVVRFLYTGTFSNLTGPSDEGGLVAAGTALRFLVESAGYKGSFVWQFRGGTGDTFIMPLYEVLMARGVRFELFREVKQVHWSDTGAIERITIDEQVKLDSDVYVPTIRVGKLRAWPGHPLYLQLDKDQAKKLRENHVDLESPWANWENYKTRVLERGTDFDQIVLAIPVGTLKTICREIGENLPRFQEMLDGVKTTATMSMQLWVRPDLDGLGMKLADWGLAPENCAPNAVVYASPMYSWLDSSQVLPYERWPEDRAPKTVAYFTGAMEDAAVVPSFSDHLFPVIQDQRLRALSQQWLWDNMGWFWPKATRPEAPNGFDPSLLVGRTEAETPAQKLEFQFYRANIDPWQRYTLSLPKSAKHRLKADQSGFSNLFLAGDWIDFGMNVGYIEGALVSGLQAARALLRSLSLG